jgi:hypothetical protein
VKAPRDWQDYLGLAFFIFLLLIVGVPLIALAVMRLFYRSDLTDFAWGVSGFPIVGPFVAALGFGFSAAMALQSIRSGSEDSDNMMLSFLFHFAGLVVFATLTVWRVLNPE